MRAYLQTLRQRLLFQTLDATVTAELMPAPRPMHKTTANYERARWLAKTFTQAFPATALRARRRILGDATLPFAPVTDVLAFGTASTVFRLGDAHVLKVYRHSIGKSVSKLHAEAAERRGRHLAVVAAYRRSAVVLAAHYLVLHGPLLGRAAVASLQPHIEEYLGVFDELSESELVEVLAGHAALRAQFHAFASDTFALAATGRCVDIAGQHNVVIANVGGTFVLRLIDTGVQDLTQLQHRGVRATHRRLERLAAVCSRLGLESQPPARQGGPGWRS